MNNRKRCMQISYAFLGIAALSISICCGGKTCDSRKNRRAYATEADNVKAFRQRVPEYIRNYQDGVSYILMTKNDYTLEFGYENYEDGEAYFIDTFEQEYDENGNPQYTDIRIPDEINSLPVYGFNPYNNDKATFQGHKEIKRVHLGKEMVFIVWDAFKGCTGLELVDMPEKLETISCRAFQKCKSLSSVSLPESLLEIEDDAFDGCSRLTSVTLPEHPFIAIGLAGSAWWDEYEQQGKPIILKKTLLHCGGWSGHVRVTKKTVNKIMKRAFENTHISFLEVDGYHSIDRLKSESLKKLKLSHIVHLDDFLISDCSNLEEVEFGEGISKIPKFCFNSEIKVIRVTSSQPVCWGTDNYKDIVRKNGKALSDLQKAAEKGYWTMFYGSYKSLKHIYIYSHKMHPSVIVAGIPKKVILHVPKECVGRYRKYVKCRVVAL